MRINRISKTSYPLGMLLLITLALSSCKPRPLPPGQAWEGIFNFSSSKGEQKAKAVFDFDKLSGVLVLPDMIPVPLETEDLKKQNDSIFFTLGFRSGDAFCKAKIHGDTITGVLYYEGLKPSPFWMAKSDEELTFRGAPKPDKDGPMRIKTYAESPTELAVKARLEAILEKYELEPYTYTKEIVIQDSIISHSHPVLTLNTHMPDETYLLSTYLHEQMHWYSLTKGEELGAMADSVFKWYPKVPIEFPEGGGTEQGTYIHILTNYLEFHCLAEVIGEEAARKHIEFMCTQHYTWIYKTVLEDYDKLREVALQCQLHP